MEVESVRPAPSWTYVINDPTVDPVGPLFVNTAKKLFRPLYGYHLSCYYFHSSIALDVFCTFSYTSWGHESEGWDGLSGFFWSIFPRGWLDLASWSGNHYLQSGSGCIIWTVSGVIYLSYYDSIFINIARKDIIQTCHLLGWPYKLVKKQLFVTIWWLERNHGGLQGQRLKGFLFFTAWSTCLSEGKGQSFVLLQCLGSAVSICSSIVIEESVFHSEA